jgi:hypothetical protein
MPRITPMHTQASGMLKMPSTKMVVPCGWGFGGDCPYP